MPVPTGSNEGISMFSVPHKSKYYNSIIIIYHKGLSNSPKTRGDFVPDPWGDRKLPEGATNLLPKNESPFAETSRNRTPCVDLNTTRHMIGHDIIMLFLRQTQFQTRWLIAQFPVWGFCRARVIGPWPILQEPLAVVSGTTTSLLHSGHWSNRLAGKIEADKACCWFGFFLDLG